MFSDHHGFSVIEELNEANGISKLGCASKLFVSKQDGHCNLIGSEGSDDGFRRTCYGGSICSARDRTEK
jgi:hypothetical protein